MHTKLTLRLGEGIIAEAKKHAQKSGRSLSQMVSDYFSSLSRRSKRAVKEVPLTPLAAQLVGSLKGSKVGLKEYHRYLEGKYR